MKLPKWQEHICGSCNLTYGIDCPVITRKKWQGNVPCKIHECKYWR